MTDVVAIKMDNNGHPHDVLQSPKIMHYPQNDTTTAERPFFIFYGQNEPPWHAHAGFGRAVHGDQKIMLSQGVEIKQLPGENSHNASLVTSTLTLYPDRSFAETDQPVVLTQPDTIVHGIGMQADLKKNDIKILSQVQGEYGKVPNDVKK